jgi:hypothetical protein
VRRADGDEQGPRIAATVNRRKDIADGPGFSRDDLTGPGGPLSTDRLAALRAHPSLSHAVRVVANAVVAIPRTRTAFINDLGRLVIANLALYLHFSRDPADPRSGLSTNRLTALCVEHGVCGKGRALNVLALMRRFGYLSYAPHPADTRLRLLVPTDLLICATRRYWETIVEAMTLVVPTAPHAISALRRDDVLGAFMRVFGRYFCLGIRLFPADAELTPFAQRNAGFALICSMLLLSEQDGPGGALMPVRISIATLARRFAVSRSQVSRILDAAVDARLLERSDAKHMRALPRLRNTTNAFYVTAFSLCSHYLRVAMDEAAGASDSASRPG